MPLSEMESERLRQVEHSLLQHVTECAAANREAEKRLSSVERTIENFTTRATYMGGAALVLLSLLSVLGPEDTRAILARIFKAFL